MPFASAASTSGALRSVPTIDACSRSPEGGGVALAGDASFERRARNDGGQAVDDVDLGLQRDFGREGPAARVGGEAGETDAMLRLPLVRGLPVLSLTSDQLAFVGE